MLKVTIKLIRLILGNLIVFANACFPPKQIQRSKEDQANADNLALTLQLYQFHLCPFCVKVRRQIKALNIKIELKNVNKDKSLENELIQLGGKRKVPCLRIEENNSIKWLYESSDINTFLRKRFS